jgi:ribosomal protein S8
MDKIIKILNEIENSSWVYRKFMSSDEIKICNKLVKDGFIYKAKPDEKNATIAFFITVEGQLWLENKNKN